MKDQADSLLKKVAVKVDEGEGIGSFLRRSGVHLGLHMLWSFGHVRGLNQASICVWMISGGMRWRLLR